MSLSRRSLFKAVGVAGISVPFLMGCEGTNGDSGNADGQGGGEEGDLTGSRLSSKAKLPAPFQRPLAIPVTIKPVRSVGDTDYFNVTVQAAKQEILPGLPTEIWGYNGTFPGPTFDTRRGRKVSVHTTNELPVPIVTHLHGGVTPTTSDGYPTDLIVPKGWQNGMNHGGDVSQVSRDYLFPLDQRAATLWYHDHRMDYTAPQVWRGLAGFHLVRDDEDDQLPLPKDEREIPLMITDRSFDADGSLMYPAIDPSGMHTPGVTDDFQDGVLGDTILVNGVPWPYLDVQAARYRFRVLNASNARRYQLELDSGGAFVQIGSDHGLLAKPVNLPMIDMAPAERFDVVIDFSKFAPGTKVTLRNNLGQQGTENIMQFRVGPRGTDNSRVPDVLSTSYVQLNKAAAVRTRKFSFLRSSSGGKMMWLIEGKPFSTEEIWAAPLLGDTEIWQFTSDLDHPVHLHLAPFQILERLGAQLAPTDGGWKDTIRLEPNQVARIIVKFDGFRGKYVFHCHNLEHEDMAMMANFQVT